MMAPFVLASYIFTCMKQDDDDDDDDRIIYKLWYLRWADCGRQSVRVSIEP